MSGVLFNAVPRLKSGSLSPRCVERQVVEVEKLGGVIGLSYQLFCFFFFQRKVLKPSPVLCPSALAPPQRPARMAGRLLDCLSPLSECR